MPTDQICPEFSDWDCVKSAPGIHVVRETHDSEFYEVAVHKSYIPWLEHHNFKFYVDQYHDRIRPTKRREDKYGKLPAQRNAKVRFLETAMEGMSSRRSHGLRSYYRSVAPVELQIPIERSILNDDVLVSASPVRI